MPLDLFPYQEQGAAYLAAYQRFGLHDEMGIGKTAQAIRALDTLDIGRGIIIVPAMLRQNWFKEFRRFARIDRRLCVGRDIHDFISWKRGRYDTLITSYEQATKWADDIWCSADFLDFVICDEGHYLKNPISKRSLAILGPQSNGSYSIMNWSQRFWHLTGTPMANDPLDIYTFLKASHATFMNEGDFTRSYFWVIPTPTGKRQEVRPDKLDELKALIGGRSLRRTQEQVGLQLPPVWLTSLLLDGDTAEVAKMLKEHPGLSDSILRSVDEGGLSFIDAQYVSTLRRLIGEAKAVPYAYMLLHEIQAGAGKRVVFGVHLDALNTIKSLLIKHGVSCVLVNGETPHKERDSAVERFQDDPNMKVFIGNIVTAGVGITLTASCDIDVFESAWSPAGNAQAVKRVHRIGQSRSVRARFMVLANSFDERVTEIVVRKTTAIAAIEGFAMNAAPLDQ